MTRLRSASRSSPGWLRARARNRSSRSPSTRHPLQPEAPATIGLTDDSFSFAASVWKHTMFVRQSETRWLLACRSKAVADGVLGDGAGKDELQQVVAAAGFAANTGHLEAAEGLPADEGAGDGPVEIEIAGEKLPPHAVERCRTARVDAAGERVRSEERRVGKT